MNSKKNGRFLIKHGMCGTRIYKSWDTMKQRCLNKNNGSYKDYGGRGIIICPEWLNSFENFYRDMGDKPKGLTLDRIDNNGNYCKSNCKWSTPKEQANNTRKNHLITFEGKTLTVAQWENKNGFKKNTILMRLRYGWSIKRALKF